MLLSSKIYIELLGGKSMKAMFELVLDRDERVVEVIKPNRKRAVTITNIMSSFFTLIFAFAFFIPGVLALARVFTIISDTGDDETMAFGLVFTMVGVVALLAAVLIIVFNIVHYHKTYYAITNKRIIIRSGYIGVDYNALEMKAIGNVAIYVGLLDKFVTPNTGTIRFGSNATPITSQGGNKGLGGLSFAHVDDAYTTYRRIKELINNAAE